MNYTFLYERSEYMDGLSIFLACLLPGAIVFGFYSPMFMGNWLDKLLEKPAALLVKLVDKINERGKD